MYPVQWLEQNELLNIEQYKYIMNATSELCNPFGIVSLGGVPWKDKSITRWFAVY